MGDVAEYLATRTGEQAMGESSSPQPDTVFSISLHLKKLQAAVEELKREPDMFEPIMTSLDRISLSVENVSRLLNGVLEHQLQRSSFRRFWDWLWGVDVQVQRR
jgi:hypothetical protein